MGRCICGKAGCEIADGLHRCSDCEKEMIKSSCNNHKCQLLNKVK